MQSTRGESKGLAMFHKVGCHAGILLLPAGGRDGSQGHASHPQQVERQSPQQVPKPAWCLTMAWMPHRPRLKQWFTFCAVTAPHSKAGYSGPSCGLCPALLCGQHPALCPVTSLSCGSQLSFVLSQPPSVPGQGSRWCRHSLASFPDVGSLDLAVSL